MGEIAAVFLYSLHVVQKLDGSLLSAPRLLAFNCFPPFLLLLAPVFLSSRSRLHLVRQLASLQVIQSRQHNTVPFPPLNIAAYGQHVSRQQVTLSQYIQLVFCKNITRIIVTCQLRAQPSITLLLIAFAHLIILIVRLIQRSVDDIGEIRCFNSQLAPQELFNGSCSHCMSNIQT